MPITTARVGTPSSTAPNGSPALAPISRRRLLRGIGFGAGAAALAACGTGAAPPPTSAPAATAPVVVKNPGSTVEIVYWGFSGGVNEKTDGEVVAKFNESQKDVKVVVQVQGNYEETANKLTFQK